MKGSDKANTSIINTALDPSEPKYNGINTSATHIIPNTQGKVMSMITLKVL